MALPRARRPSRRGVLLLSLLAACGRGEPPKSVLLVTLDTTRRDAVGVFGAPEGITPHLDALGREGLSYDEARTVAPLTMPSHASMLTGLYPPRHTVRDNNLRPLPRSAETLAERALAADFRTAAFVSSVAVDRAFGFAQGFETYDQPASSPGVGEIVSQRRAAETVAAARKWFAANGSKPFFVWVHLFDPHQPYAASPEHLERANGDPYLAEVAATDDALGSLFEELREQGLWETTVVFLVADHGEGRGDHGENTHGYYTYSSTIRVPYIVRWPNATRAGERSAEYVSVVDVFPTALDAMGLTIPDNIDGLSLKAQPVPAERGVYFESYAGYFSYGWSPLVGWSDASGTYIHGVEPRLLSAAEPDSAGDPIGAKDPRAVDFQRRIAEVASAERLSSEDDRVGEDMLEHLRGLGYVAVGSAEDDTPHPLDVEGRPNPYERNEELELTLAAMNASVEGRFEDASRLLRRLLEENPENRVALEHLAHVQVSDEKWDDAIETLRRLVALGTRGGGTHYNLGMALLSADRRDEAIEEFEATVALNPNHTDALVSLVSLLDEDGRQEDANRYAELLKQANRP